MTSSPLEELLDVVFGSNELPTENQLLTLAHFNKDVYPSDLLVRVIRLMWLDQNDPEAFDEAIMNEL